MPISLNQTAHTHAHATLNLFVRAPTVLSLYISRNSLALESIATAAAVETNRAYSKLFVRVYRFPL